MEHLKITRVDNVFLVKGKNAFLGTLHLTAHHLIFRFDSGEEIWVFYSMIHLIHRDLANPHNQITLDLHCRNFLFIRLLFSNETHACDVYESLNKLIHISSLEQMYAFIYWPGTQFKVDGWQLYDYQKEFARQLGSTPLHWRRTCLNEQYELCPTYPQSVFVPSKISDSVLKYAVKHRSKMRFPTLAYLHRNGATLTRCSQPMVGVKNNRSLQDEKLIDTIFAMPIQQATMPTENLIVDARPMANAMANTAKGAGTENMEYYKNARKVFMGIDNIHVMRESLSKMMEALNQSVIEGRSPQLAQLEKSNWLYHLKMLLDATFMIVETLHQAHVMIHCSDGWDRTAQLVSLVQVCLDPYFRTLEGFLVLIDKDWLSFGHKFSDRSGHFSGTSSSPSAPNYFSSSSSSSSSKSSGNALLQKMQQKYYQSMEQREVSPVFHQFLDSVYQLLWQYPTCFEFNEKLLKDLQFHVYSGQFGTFLTNCEKERNPLKTCTHALWSYILEYDSKYLKHARADVLATGVFLKQKVTKFRYWTAGIVEFSEAPLEVELDSEDFESSFLVQSGKDVVEKMSSLWSRWSRFGSNTGYKPPVSPVTGSVKSARFPEEGSGANEIVLGTDPDMDGMPMKPAHAVNLGTEEDPLSVPRPTSSLPSHATELVEIARSKEVEGISLKTQRLLTTTSALHPSIRSDSDHGEKASPSETDGIPLTTQSLRSSTLLTISTHEPEEKNVHSIKEVDPNVSGVKFTSKTPVSSINMSQELLEMVQTKENHYIETPST